jgi:hypothetical protein
MCSQIFKFSSYSYEVNNLLVSMLQIFICRGNYTALSYLTTIANEGTFHTVAVEQYTFTHKQYLETTQLIAWFGRLSGIRTQNGQTKISVKLTA